MRYPVLALDVATGPASVALITSTGEVFAAEGAQGKQHSQTVLPLLQDVLSQAGLKWTDLGMLALGQGPGSFTGLRIASAIMAGINASLQLPIWGISSLAITSIQTDSDLPIWVFEDARAGEVFMGCYQQGDVMKEDVCQLWQDVEKMPTGAFAAHQEPPIALQGWQRLPLTKSRPDALASFIQQQWNQVDHNKHGLWVEPAYLQLSQAEKNLQHA
jgi:tRNA threonylcarbamoyl adenosine modification protein YeaZ